MPKSTEASMTNTLRRWNISDSHPPTKLALMRTIV